MQALLTERSAPIFRGVSLLVLATALVFGTGTVLIDGGFVRPPIAWIFPVATAIVGIVALAAYVRFLRVADELLRKIHVEALALAFGTGAVFMIVYRLCERLGAPKLDSNDPLLVMGIACCIGLWLGVRRYS